MGQLFIPGGPDRNVEFPSKIKTNHFVLGDLGGSLSLRFATSRTFGSIPISKDTEDIKKYHLLMVFSYILVALIGIEPILLFRT